MIAQILPIVKACSELPAACTIRATFDGTNGVTAMVQRRCEWSIRDGTWFVRRRRLFQSSRTANHMKGDDVMNRRKAVTPLIMMLAVLVFTGIPASAAGTPVELTGRTTFAGYFSTSGFVFSPADWNYCDASATIVHEEGGILVVEVTECVDMRTCTWELKVTNGGVAKGEMVSCDPDFETGSLVGDVKLHTGCAAEHGTFPVYHGTWDGTTLRIASGFHGRCDGGSYWGAGWFWDLWGGVDDPEGYLDDGVTWDDGPAHVTFALELTVP